MKTKTYIILGLGLILLLGHCYAQNETYNAADTTIFAGNETTVEPVTTTTTATTTTSLEATTTTSSAETTTTTLKSNATATQTQPKATTTKKKTCNSYCKNIGYNGGECRLNGLECRVRLEVKSVYGGKLCPTARLDTCCCETDNSLSMDSKYSYTLNTPIEPLQESNIQKAIKNLQTQGTTTTKDETEATLKAYMEDTAD